jgi:osmotically-inducible protein OsmY
MTFSGKSRHNNIITAGLTAALLAMSAISATSYAQNSEANAPSGPRGAADTDLVARVKQALHSAKYLDDRHISVGVENGDVVLNGFVQDNRALLTASQVATKAAGDHKIINHLSIKQTYENGHGT